MTVDSSPDDRTVSLPRAIPGSYWVTASKPTNQKSVGQYIAPPV